MSWAKFAIEKLREGQTVQIKPRGHSMKGKVNDGDLVTIEPCETDDLSVGDIVLVRVKGVIIYTSSKPLIKAAF
jgi:SOS-response transcriptional repressor LexA